MLIEEGWHSDEAIDYYLSKLKITPPSSSFITSLVYLTIHHLKFVDHIIEKYLHKRKSLPRKAKWILRTGVVQYLFMERVPPYAIVNESVNIAHEENLGKLSGVINAILRKVTSSTKIKPALEDLYPKWIIEEAKDVFGEEHSALLYSHINKPPFVIRPNLIITSREKLMEKISKHMECFPTLHSPIGIEIRGTKKEVEKILRPEEYFVQDEGSQLVVFLLDLNKNRYNKILDLCSAPGGKGTLLQGLLKNSAELYMVDSNKDRVKKLVETVKIQKIKVKRIIIGDASVDIPSLKKEYFDLIIVDPPCTDLGVIRRHPEIKWRKKKSDAINMSILQYKILKKAGEYLKEGGHILYSVCTFTAEETFEVIEKITRESNFRVITPSSPHIPSKMLMKERFMLTQTNLFNTDTFFACILQKDG